MHVLQFGLYYLNIELNVYFILNSIFVVNGKQECFDEVNIWCDWPERVNCGNRPICDENDENCNEVKSFYLYIALINIHCKIIMMS